MEEDDEMSDPIFDFDSFDPMFPISDNMAVDMNGHFKMRFSDNMAMDMDTGKMHFTTNWSQPDADDDDDF